MKYNFLLLKEMIIINRFRYVIYFQKLKSKIKRLKFLLNFSRLTIYSIKYVNDLNN